MRRNDAAVVVFLLALTPLTTAAQTAADRIRWLPPGSRTVADELLRPRENADRSGFLVELGRLAFRSPLVLGGNARRAGLSCDSCHVGGHGNARFFIPGLSDAPGRVDVSHGLWNPLADDGIANPKAIPDLHGVRTRHRLGSDGRFASLREFTRHAIVVEFAGEEPPPWLLDALVAYLQALAAVPANADATETVTLAGDLAAMVRHVGVLEQAVADERAALADPIIDMIRGRLGAVHARFPESEAARAVVEGWARDLQRIAGQVAAGDWPGARTAATALRQALRQPPASLTSALPGSLYDPATVSMRIR